MRIALPFTVLSLACLAGCGGPRVPVPVDVSASSLEPRDDRWTGSVMRVAGRAFVVVGEREPITDHERIEQREAFTVFAGGYGPAPLERVYVEQAGPVDVVHALVFELRCHEGVQRGRTYAVLEVEAGDLVLAEGARVSATPEPIRDEPMTVRCEP